MKSEVHVLRPLFGETIRQSNQNGYFSVNDLLLAGNKWRIANNLQFFKYDSWYNSTSTQDFLNELQKNIDQPAIVSKKGKTGQRWVHPYVFIDLALAISPKLKIEVYGWLFDELIRYRNDSGDSYKKMCGALFDNTKNKTDFPRAIKKVAEMIQSAIGVKNWQEATEEQLKMRDKIHENIALLTDVLRDNNQAVILGIRKSI
jgi:hypothetical protein